jgi:HPt (histidine-containing phosphotransfer) domain-containing protein
MPMLIYDAMHKKGITMFDLVLFGTIGLLLLILIGFLVIVIRDHMKSKSFELYVHQSQTDLQKEANRSTEEKKRREHKIPPRRKSAPAPEPANTLSPEEKSEPLEEEKPSAPQQPAESQEAAQPAPESEEGPTLYRLHPEPKAEASPAQKAAEEILQKDYGVFSHQRLVEGMGLSPEEADEFVVELIHQLETAINDLDRAIEEKNFTEVEHITHGLKGAALNIGEGGVAQLLTEYNTYMKEGTDLPVIEAYQTHLKRTVSDLKVEYSQVA